MAEGGELANTLRTELQNGARSIAEAWTAETTLRNIPPLIRRNDGRFWEWVRDMERCFLIIGVEENRKRNLALITTAGQVGDYVNKIITADPLITWEDLKIKLGEFCKQVRNPKEMFHKLTSIRQGSDESMLEYIHRLETLADRAYETEVRGHEIVRAQVQGFFIEGIRNTNIKLAVLRAEPETIEEACKVALTESKWQQKAMVSQDRWEEPMEVCHARRRRTPRYSPTPNRKETYNERDRWSNYRQSGERNQPRFEPRMVNHGPPPPRYNTRQNPGNGMRPSGRGPTDGRRN